MYEFQKRAIKARAIERAEHRRRYADIERERVRELAALIVYERTQWRSKFREIDSYDARDTAAAETVGELFRFDASFRDPAVPAREYWRASSRAFRDCTGGRGAWRRNFYPESSDIFRRAFAPVGDAFNICYTPALAAERLP